MVKKRRTKNKGFTLIEIVMVIMLVGILAIVAIPQFIDLRTEARDETSKGALGALRGAVSNMVAAVALKEPPASSPTTYPSFAEMTGNAMLAAAPGNHTVLAGTNIMDPSAGIPNNPWTNTSTVHDCTGQALGTLLAAPDNDDGWCYNPTTGQIWANSDLSNGGTTENNF